MRAADERVFVTGGSGFVGGAVVRHLLAHAIDVRALARTDRAATAIARLGATPVPLTLADEAGLTAAIRGCSTVFHIAGTYEICPRDPAGMDRVNVQGTAHVIRAAARAGVRRVVHTSSAATIGEAAGAVGTETTTHRGAFLNEYERSKFFGERRAFETGRDHGVEVVSVNPSSVHGPGRTEGTARLWTRAARSRLALVLQTWISIVDVDDCARAHLLVAERGRPGERYLVSGASLPVGRAVELVRRVTGRPSRVVWIPRRAVAAAIPFAEALVRARPGARPCPAMLRTLLHGHRYDGSRAVRELGLQYTRVEDTVERTLRWQAELGLIDAPVRA